MDRQLSLSVEKLAAEGHVRALRHAKDAVDRSVWLLAMLRRELAGEARVGGLRRLELHCVLADLERRQAGLSAAYGNMAATPTRPKAGQLKAFVRAYDEFLDAVCVARMEAHNDAECWPVSKQSADWGRPPRGLPAADSN